MYQGCFKRVVIHKLSDCRAHQHFAGHHIKCRCGRRSCSRLCDAERADCIGLDIISMVTVSGLDAEISPSVSSA
ncbi:hypothetical protein O9993_17985 [Vibrio lentus]|nr:hypothetical protein [Vibrio lentus]